MICIFCLKDRPGTEEHIFPLALGGSLVTERICRDCNSKLGHKVDTHLINHPLLAMRRWEFGLPGNSGKVPDAIRQLLGNAHLEDESQQRVTVSMGADGVVDVRLIYLERELDAPNGQRVKRITIDARDGARLNEIIPRQRKRAGLEPLSPADLMAEVAQIVANNTSKIEQPRVRGSVDIDTMRYKLGVLKIAYELAFHWFGDVFLAQPEAAQLRDVLMGQTILEQSSLVGTVRFGLHQPMSFWPARNTHVAYSIDINGRAAIGIKLFDLITACVYVGDAAVLPCGHHISLEVETGQVTESSFWAALRQVAYRLKRVLLRLSSSLASLPIIGRATMAAP